MYISFVKNKIKIKTQQILHYKVSNAQSRLNFVFTHHKLASVSAETDNTTDMNERYIAQKFNTLHNNLNIFMHKSSTFNQDHNKNITLL